MAAITSVRLVAIHVPDPNLWGRGARRLLVWVRQWLCGLRGHEAVIHFETGHLHLECLSCGHRTRGWDIDLRHRSPAGRHPVTGEPGRLGRPGRVFNAIKQSYGESR